MAPSPRPQAPTSRRRRGARFAAGASVVLIGGVWAVQETWAESHWVSAILTYAPPACYLTLSALALLLGLLALDRRAILWALAGGALCLVGVARPSLPVSRPRAPVARTLRVVSWNIHERLDRIPELRAERERLDPDVLCLQEANGREFEALWPEAEIVRADSLIIMTHGDIADHRSIQLRKEGHYLRPFLEAEIVVDRMRVTVLNAHLYSFQLAAAMKHPSAEKAQEVAEGAVAMRTVQVDRLTAWLDSQGGPALIAGDFNTPPRGRLYGRLRERATDAFAASGRGWGWTFPKSHPLLRIDYLWLTGGLEALRCRRVAGGPSDHCAVVADIAVP
ncbi:MAG: hypothetical protein FJX74_05890 [Armatimonadetes bacterium]|nr:hypothetical protein [Armatimonadota bacterium]